MKILMNIAYLAFAIPTLLFHIVMCYMILLVINILPIQERHKNMFSNKIKVFSHHAIISIAEFWFNRPIYLLYNKKIISVHSNIVISNHCSDFDWMFVSHALKHLGQLESLYILMKMSLKNVPILGFILKSFGYLFLNRSRNKDANLIKQYARRFNNKNAYNILIFPEGTYPYKDSLRDAIQFAISSNITIKGQKYLPKRVLLPRKLGFTLIKNGLGNTNQGVIDITLLTNPYYKMPSEDCSLYDIFIKGSKFINQAIILSYVPNSKITKDFLNETFAEKDRMLDRFVSKYNGIFQNQNEFKDFVRNENLLNDDNKLEILNIKSQYKPYFLLTSPYILIGLYFIIRFIGHRIF